MKRWVCRYFTGHKWVHFQTPSEEAYRCSRCGKRHYGKLTKRDISDFGAGGLGGGGGNGGGG